MPVKSNGFLLIKCSNTTVTYCVHILHNILGYKNNLCVMEAKVLNSYGKRANNSSIKMPNFTIGHLFSRITIFVDFANFPFYMKIVSLKYNIYIIII